MASVIYWALMAPITVEKLPLQWARMQGEWVQREDGKVMWKDGDLDEKLEGVELEEDSGFGGPGWSRSKDTA